MILIMDETQTATYTATHAAPLTATDSVTLDINEIEIRSHPNIYTI